MAERTGLEPATSGVTGQHSNQLNYRSTLVNPRILRKPLFSPIPPEFASWIVTGVPKGIRTPVTAVKGRCPRPLDEGDPDLSLRLRAGDWVTARAIIHIPTPNERASLVWLSPNKH